MAVEGVNQVTKIGIIVISVILGFLIGYHLFVLITDKRDFDIDKVLQILQIVCTLILCVLAFWGAFTENACLCYIALVACAVAFAFAIWSFVKCFIQDHGCQTEEYVMRGITLGVFGLMVIAVYLFIGSIK